MAFITPDPRHLDRADRSPARPARSPRSAATRVPGVGRLAGRARPRPRTSSSTRSRTTCSSTATCRRRCADLMDRGSSGRPVRGDLRGLRDLLDRLRDAGGTSSERAGSTTRWRTSGAELRRDRGARSGAGGQRRLDETEPGAGRRGRARSRRGPGCLRAPSPRSASTSLDALPPDVGARVRALQDYDFIDGDARQRFEDLARPPPRVDARPYRSRARRRRQVDEARGPRGAARDGARAQRASRAADRRRRAGAGGRRRVPRPATARSSRVRGRSTT